MPEFSKKNLLSLNFDKIRFAPTVPPSIDPQPMSKVCLVQVNPDEVCKDHKYVYISGSPIDERIRNSNTPVLIINLSNAKNSIAENKNIEEHHFEVNDGMDIVSTQRMETMLPIAIDLIENALRANKQVLVHCNMGMSRSATIVIALLMKMNRWDLDTAREHLRAYRSSINVNLGFLSILARYKQQGFPRRIVPLQS